MQRRHLLALLGTSLLASAGHSKTTPSGPALPLGAAINRSGRLRALSQRVAKLHVQSTLGVLPERAGDVMRQCRQLIEGSLGELARQPLNADTQALMPRLQGHAERLLVLTAGSGAPPRTDDVVRAADDMLRSADELTSAFEKQASQGGARVVNVARRSSWRPPGASSTRAWPTWPAPRCPPRRSASSWNWRAASGCSSTRRCASPARATPCRRWPPPASACTRSWTS